MTADRLHRRRVPRGGVFMALRPIRPLTRRDGGSLTDPSRRFGLRGLR